MSHKSASKEKKATKRKLDARKTFVLIRNPRMTSQRNPVTNPVTNLGFANCDCMEDHFQSHAWSCEPTGIELKLM